ncbi:MAG: hypothetical protein Q7T26_07905 [Dehalococcoidia bacterium]|nr:hypothetical protein [Dehalococcoidia bacterium]
MEIVKAVTRLELTEAFRPFLDLRDLARVAGDNPKAELQGPPFEFTQPQKKQRVLLHMRALVLEHEGLSSIEEGAKKAVELLAKVQAVSPVPKVNRLRFDVLLIEPYPLPFHELVLLMKKQYLKDSALVDASTDVGFSFDQQEGTVVKHFQIGPMAPVQLRTTYLTWGPEKLPDCFVFLSLGYERNEEFAFETKTVESFLQTATKWQTGQAEAILETLRLKRS